MNEANARSGLVKLRSALPDDATALTDIFLTAIAVSVPGLPLAHSRDEIIDWLRTKQIPERTVTVAEADERAVGFIASETGWIHQLFIAPAFQRKGVGSVLLASVIAKADRATRLWAFQRNAQARSFYEGRGFAAEMFTDGAENEERTPDVLYVWRPSHFASVRR